MRLWLRAGLRLLLVMCSLHARRRRTGRVVVRGFAVQLIPARDQVAWARGFAQAFRDNLQQVVADVVTQCVVDALEGVQVHEQHGKLLVAHF